MVDHGSATMQPITQTDATGVDLNQVDWPAEGTMVPESISLDPATPFGGAVQPLGGGRIRVNTAKIKRIYKLTSSDERKRQDRKTCGMLHSDFKPDQSEYEDGRYE